MRNKSPENKKEKLNPFEKTILDRYSFLVFILNKRIWNKIVEYYKKKYANSPEKLAKIDSLTRRDKIRNNFEL
jgi:hypothetical protein